MIKWTCTDFISWRRSKISIIVTGKTTTSTTATKPQNKTKIMLNIFIDNRGNTAQCRSLVVSGSQCRHICCSACLAFRWIFWMFMHVLASETRGGCAEPVHFAWTEAGESGYGDMHIHMQAPSAFLPLTVGSLFICCKTFFLSGFHLDVFSRFPGFSFFPPSSGLCVGVLPWISFSSTFFLMVDTWMLTKAKEESVKTPSRSIRLAQLFFSFMVYSWRGFGRVLTSWKIQCCPRVLPHMYRMNLAGNKLIPGAFGTSREEFSDRQASTISHRKGSGFHLKVKLHRSPLFLLLRPKHSFQRAG